ncbi:hypothetical protein PR048_000815 [Dryococelus australis]|uniref:Uncharacterized protein n=1 Tax=Dryococelus australis TaxID=614101 RepID=A0ABQ9IFP0_9NEOP|nr:hypothetical protein PR048_000815 [Dryococelus australis]
MKPLMVGKLLTFTISASCHRKRKDASVEGISHSINRDLCLANLAFDDWTILSAAHIVASLPCRVASAGSLLRNLCREKKTSVFQVPEKKDTIQVIAAIMPRAMGNLPCWPSARPSWDTLCGAYNCNLVTPHYTLTPRQGTSHSASQRHSVRRLLKRTYGHSVKWFFCTACVFQMITYSEASWTDRLLGETQTEDIPSHGRGKLENLEKTRQPATSSGTIPTCQNPGATLPVIEPSWAMWEASSLTTTRPDCTSEPHLQQECTSYHQCHTCGSDMKRERGRNGKESAMAFVKDPSPHSPGVLLGNHGKTGIRMAKPGLKPRAFPNLLTTGGSEFEHVECSKDRPLALLLTPPDRVEKVSGNYLVATSVVTQVYANGVLHEMPHGVHTHLPLPYGAGRQRWSGVGWGRQWVYGAAPECKSGGNEISLRKPVDQHHHLAQFPQVKIPVVTLLESEATLPACEVSAPVSTPHGLLTNRNVAQHLNVNILAEGDIPGKWHGGVIILLELVHPDFGSPPRVAREHVTTASREGVGMPLAEDMTHPAAGDYLQAASTLPHPERDLCNHTCVLLATLGMQLTRKYNNTRDMFYSRHHLCVSFAHLAMKGYACTVKALELRSRVKSCIKMCTVSNLLAVDETLSPLTYKLFTSLSTSRDGISTVPAAVRSTHRIPTVEPAGKRRAVCTFTRGDVSLSAILQNHRQWPDSAC